MTKEQYQVEVIDKYWHTPFNEIPEEFTSPFAYGMELLTYEKYMGIPCTWENSEALPSWWGKEHTDAN